MTPERLTEEQRELAAANIALAQYLADVSFQRMDDRVDRDDILSAAYSGLTIAAKNYAPLEHGRSEETIKSGMAFSAYARRRILGSILDWQRSQDHVPRRQRKVYKELQEKDVEGTPMDVLASELGVTPERLKTIVARVEAAPVSLNEEPSDTTRTYASQIPSEDDVEGETVAKKITEALVARWEKLPSDERLIVALHYYGEVSLGSIAAMLDIPIDEVVRLHDESVRLLHEAMKKEATESHG